MRRRSRGRVFIFGVGGLLLGALAEWLLPQVYPAFAMHDCAHDCMLWGAIIGLSIGYLPNFVRMGSEITKGQNKTLNLLAGVGAFLAISAVVILVFLFVLWVVSRFYR